MTDQEQTERGASMISGSVTWTPYDETIRQLRADLERVTAERDQLRARFESACELLERMQAHLGRTGLARLGESYVDTVLPRLIAERDAMREVVECVRSVRNVDDGYESLWVALARLDATRKATADATEEGK